MSKSAETKKDWQHLSKSLDVVWEKCMRLDLPRIGISVHAYTWVPLPLIYINKKASEVKDPSVPETGSFTIRANKKLHTTAHAECPFVKPWSEKFTVFLLFHHTNNTFHQPADSALKGTLNIKNFEDLCTTSDFKDSHDCSWTLADNE